MKNETKALITIMVIGFVIIGVYFAMDFKENTPENENNNGEKLEVEEGNLKLISYAEYKQKVENKEKFIMVVTQTGCGGCDHYKPILEGVLKEQGVVAYELDILQNSQEDMQKFGSEFPVEYTPTTLIFIDGEEKTDLSIVGSIDEDGIIDFLTEYEFLK